MQLQVNLNDMYIYFTFSFSSDNKITKLVLMALENSHVRRASQIFRNFSV